MKFDEAALRDFFEQVPELYQATAAAQGSYQGLLYTIEHPLDRADLEAITRAYGLPQPRWTNQSADIAIQILDKMMYPQAEPLGRLRAVPGLTLSATTHILHHVHHAYPIYDELSCMGLARLGVDVPYVRMREPAAYGLFVAAVEQLKQRIPYWCVPETNVVLGRIVQGALRAHGRASGQ